MKFRRIKDVSTHPLHWFMLASAAMPSWVQRGVFGGMDLLGKGYYYTPGSHARKTTRNFRRIAGGAEARRVYFDLVDNVVFAGCGFGKLISRGATAVADLVTFDESFAARMEAVRAEKRSGIVVVPHCTGAVLSAAGFARRFPILLVVRESRSPSRSRIMRRYIEILGAEAIYVRHTDPGAVARAILLALRAGKFVIGTTDVARGGPDTVEAQFFGHQVPLPAWPARFSRQRKAPIVPGYMRVSGGRIVVSCGEPYVERDVAASTQRWAGFFEKSIRESPSDWFMMLDKHWAAVLARAAEAGQGAAAE